MLIKPLDQSYKKSTRLGATFMTVFSGGVALLVLFELARLRPDLWQFHFSWYAVLSGIGVVTNLFLIRMVNRRQQSIESSIRYDVLLLGFIILGLSETFQRLSIRPEAALFWRQLTIFGAVLTPVALLVFVFYYTGRHALKHYIWAAVALLASGLLFIHIGLTTDLIYRHQISGMLHTFYGYEIAIGPLATIYFLWIQVVLILSIVELVRYRRLLPSGSKRRQAQIFIFAIIFLLVSSSIVEVILPAVNIVFLPLGSLLGTVMAAMIAYGMTLGGAFSVNPATLVANILDTMADAVIVTDTDFNVIYSNKFTAVHLQLPEYQMIGHSISEFLEEATFTKIKAALANYEPGKQIAIIDQGEMKTQNYEQRYVDISLSKVMESGQLVGYIFSFANSSEPKFRADLAARGRV
ncbi:MAG TPA: histidine kinase N-terminal 7TM domain-containing protein [Candidatus Saccharimonadales bacterium]|nr:histidine kinase N-terminal 7TM domain-containing protein [Candidatus Saccharimonadales bacterium]